MRNRWEGRCLSLVTSLCLGVGAVSAGCDRAEVPSGVAELPLASKGSSGSGSGGGSSGGGGGGGNPAPLSTVVVPAAVGGDVIDRAAAARLGKALFWDTQTGGDGKIACATCHYHAGADTRLLNVINPGPDGVFASGTVTGPGQWFVPS